jgi:4-hydroxy-2-oxoheptanedioate aldolase
MPCVVNAVKFPPLGNRGLDGSGLDADFGLDVFRPNSAYSDDINRETFVVVQIETLEALENADEIASVPGIDALFVGPGDLGLRLDRVEPNAGITLDTAICRVAEVARRHNIVWGMPAGTPEQITELRELGAQLLAYRGDFELTNVLKNSIQEFDKALGETV